MLTYGPDAELALELVGRLPNRTATRIATGAYRYGVDSGVYKIIHGDVHGRAVTLLDCLVIRSRGPFSMGLRGDSGGETDITATTVLLGVHLDTADDPVFTMAEARTEGLTAWSGQGALTLMPSEDGLRTESIGARLPGRQDATVGEDRYALEHWIQGFNPQHRGDGTHIDVRHEVRLTVEPNSPQSLAGLRNKVAFVVDLVSLARRDRPVMLGMRVGLAGRTSGQGRARWVDVLWRQRLEVRATGTEGVAFTAAGMGFDSLLVHWSQRIDSLRSAVHLLQASWEEGGFLEATVLSLATAVESYSDSLDLVQKLNVDGHQRLVEAALDACPVEFHQPLRSMLANFNEPSLRSRIDAVAARLPEAVRRQLLPNPQAWARKLYAARNELSHAGRTALGFDLLADLRQVTSAVIYLVLLTEVGLDEDALLSTIERDGYLRHACVRSTERFEVASDDTVAAN